MQSKKCGCQNLPHLGTLRVNIPSILENVPDREQPLSPADISNPTDTTNRPAGIRGQHTLQFKQTNG